MVTGLTTVFNTITAVRGITIAGGIAAARFTVSIGVGIACIAILGGIYKPVATMRRVPVTISIADSRRGVAIGITRPIVTELLALDLTIPTDRGNRAAVRGAVVAILGIAIITGFPGLSATIAAARTRRIGGAADVVEDRRADALVGFTALGAFRTGQAFPVGWAVGGTVAK